MFTLEGNIIIPYDKYLTIVIYDNNLILYVHIMVVNDAFRVMLQIVASLIDRNLQL